MNLKHEWQERPPSFPDGTEVPEEDENGQTPFPFDEGPITHPDEWVCYFRGKARGQVWPETKYDGPGRALDPLPNLVRTGRFCWWISSEDGYAEGVASTEDLALQSADDVLCAYERASVREGGEG
jgi:hypothetical protein